MYLRVQIGLFWTFVFLSSSVGLNVFDTCDEDGPGCPTGSRCMWRGCDGKKCICENNLLPSLNKTSCVKETPLGESCKIGSMCVGQPLSECRLNTNCSCLEGYKPSVNGTYCVLIMDGDDTAAEFGQYCDNEKFWCFPDDLRCSNKRCECESGFRPATEEERYAEPYNTRYCRSKSFQLGVPVNVNGAECQKPEASTTQKTLSTSSTPSSTSTPVMSRQSSTTTSSTSTPSSTTLTSTSTTTASTETTTFSTPKSTTTLSTTESTTVAPTSANTTSSTTESTSSTTITTNPTTTAKKTRPSTTTVSSTTTASTTKVSTAEMTSSSTTTFTTISSTITVTQKPSASASSSSAISITTPETVTTNITSETVTSTTPNLTALSTSSKVDTTSTSRITENSTNVSLTPKTDTLSSSSTKSAPTKTPVQTHNSVSTVSSFTKHSSSTASAAATSTSTTVGVGDKCHNKKCPVNSECVTDACTEERCRCKLGYADSPDGQSCWKLSALGEECGAERRCQGQKTQCGDKGVCDCEDGYERSDSGRWCRLKTSWFIDFPVVGEECSGGFFSQCYMHFEQSCVDGKCQCKEGFREIVDKQDMDAIYPDIVQCRNETFVTGAREDMLCLHQSRQSREYDMYDRAKSKIRKIQGAIIGGCVGFVAMLGIVIGVVALVRWKRRGRREPIRDSSSTASTDATSRYSFKIPRPFTHFLGAKEYDSTQISYPNEVFDKDEDAVHNEPKPDVVNVGTLARQNQNTQNPS